MWREASVFWWILPICCNSMKGSFTQLLYFFRGILKHTQGIWNLSIGQGFLGNKWYPEMTSREQVNGWVFPVTGGHWFSSLIKYHFNKRLVSDFYCSTILLPLCSLAVGCDLVASRLRREIAFFLPKNCWRFILYALPRCPSRFCTRLGLNPVEKADNIEFWGIC